MIEHQWRLSLKNAFARLLHECKSMRQLKRIHTHLITSPFFSKTDHFFLTTRLLFFCSTSEFGSLTYADAVFRFIQDPDLFVYNALIRGYACNINVIGGDEHVVSTSRALTLYKQMLCNGVSPNCLTFPFLVKECGKRGLVSTGYSIHAHVIHYGNDSDLFVQNSMISFYSECGVLRSARHVFDEMPVRDVVSWTSIIMGCLRNGDADSASDLFNRMEKRSIVTWNAMMTGLVRAGRSKEALEVFLEMLITSNGTVKPDKTTVASALAACAALGAIDRGKSVHGYLKRSGLEFDEVIGTALVNMYGKCGVVERAIEVFNEMPRKDIVAWTAMIAVFSQHGYCDVLLIF